MYPADSIFDYTLRTCESRCFFKRKL